MIHHLLAIVIITVFGGAADAMGHMIGGPLDRPWPRRAFALFGALLGTLALYLSGWYQ